jgi:uncharacterized protein (DUF433 family)
MSRAPKAPTLATPDARPTLAEAEAAVVVDPYILSGTPVLRGTRVPVHDVAALVESRPLEEVLEDYPGLTVEMTELARIYAAAHPAEERPRRRITDMFPGAVVVSRRRIKL